MSESKRNFHLLRLVVEDSHQTHLSARSINDKDNNIYNILLNGKNNFSYLSSITRKGQRINVIVNEFSCNNIEPELIILAPDHLIDITAIAECFEPFGTSELNSLIKKIEPEQLSSAILLGNFAGQLLDETINSDPDCQFQYSKSISKFFKQNALRISACDDNSTTFHSDAKIQQKNIEVAVNSLLNRNNGSAASHILLEPSFFCEALGLQGRMDMLHSEMSFIVEQKSGKGEWGSNPAGTPVSKVNHIVQLLLYKAVLLYGGYLPVNTEIKSFLLYSKYPSPLVQTNDSPELLKQALDLRNKIVNLELSLAQPNGFSILSDLNPEQLNANRLSSKFWTSYIEPRLKATISPIQSASEIERHYVLRFLEFIASEHIFAKTGYNSITGGAGFSASWNLSLEEKSATGNICYNLSLSIPESQEAIEDIVLSDDESQNNQNSNFRVGDIVILYSHHNNYSPDIRQSICFRATITAISDNSITIHLRAPQSNRSVFSVNCRWAIEHDLIEASFRNLYKSVYSFLSAPIERRQLILAQRKPEISDNITLIGEYGRFNEMVRQSKAAHDIFALIGPPGTGKTTYGLMNILNEELLNPESSVILCAYTNRAVDEICTKLTQASIPFIRIGSHTGSAPEFHDKLISTLAERCRNKSDVLNLLNTARVIVGTTQSLSAVASALFKNRRFSLAIIDEASQILEPHLLGLMCATSTINGVGTVSSISRFVLIGDHHQLPAVVQQSVEQSCVEDERLNAIGLTDCRNSFFERFLKFTASNQQGLVYKFEHQGRMHAHISSIASQLFYNNRLTPIPLQHQTCEIPFYETSECTPFGKLLNSKRVSFINVQPNQTDIGKNSNTAEAETIARLTAEILLREGSSFNNTKTLGIIVPYRNQISSVRAEIKRLIPETDLSEITIDTVERFQGSQREYIIYGFTVSHPSQLPFLQSSRFTADNGDLIDRKLNVAITRSRSHLILVGNRSLLSTDHIFRKLFNLIDNC